MREIPIPPWIEDYRLDVLPDGRRQLSFEAEETYPSSRVRDYYAEWARANDWEKIPPEREAWSSDRWTTYRGMAGERVDQWTVHWQSPDETESLLLALLHTESRDRQMVYVIRSPFYLLSSDQLVEEAEPNSSGAPCEGGFEEPEPLYKPVPPVGVLHEHCRESVVEPTLLILINGEGRVASVDFVQGSGCEHADELLRQCVSEWVFTSPKCDGKPVEVQRGVTITWEGDRSSSSEIAPCRPFEGTVPPNL